MAWVAPKTSTFTRNAAVAGVSIDQSVERTFLARVYTFMALGLGITGIVALAVAASPAAMSFIFGGRAVLLGLIVVELLLVMAFARAPVSPR